MARTWRFRRSWSRWFAGGPMERGQQIRPRKPRPTGLSRNSGCFHGTWRQGGLFHSRSAARRSAVPWRRPCPHPRRPPPSGAGPTAPRPFVRRGQRWRRRLNCRIAKSHRSRPLPLRAPRSTSARKTQTAHPGAWAPCLHPRSPPSAPARPNRRPTARSSWAALRCLGAGRICSFGPSLLHPFFARHPRRCRRNRMIPTTVLTRQTPRWPPAHARWRISWGGEASRRPHYRLCLDEPPSARLGSFGGQSDD
ncbi:hypothetical protein T484DRAFT_1938459 [Baffinella frigidus]|nr:hypothetical protein T484DRAFT_1938459 [Cryptophyta sp. CCMP2293]